MRFFIDDPTRQDPRALLNTVRMSAILDMVTKTNTYIKRTDTAILTLEADCFFSLNGAVFRTAETLLTTSNLDVGDFTVGKDYYIYICDLGGGQDEVYKISLNSTFPAGFTAFTSRKIGSFHYGLNRVVNAAKQPINSAGAAFGTDWELEFSIFLYYKLLLITNNIINRI